MGDKIAPRFTKKPALRQEGAAIIFGCQIEAAPQPQITWYKGDAVLTESDRITFALKNVPKSALYDLSLRINNVSADDGGAYKVEVKNPLGQMAANVNLNLQAPDPSQGAGPQFKQKPSIKQAEGKIIFECRLSSKTPPQITWFKDDNKLAEGGRYKYVTRDEGGETYYVALELSDPQAGDGATYKLNAKNQFGESNANLKLNFDMPGAPAGTPPKFTAKPTIKQVGAGVVFEVRLTADPAPQISWFKGDTAVVQSDRHKLSTKADGKNYVLLLEIPQVTPSDGGTYKVTAKNQFGESNANINLNLEGAAPPKGKAPKFLEKPSIKQEGNNIILTCLMEGEPKPNISWFKNDKPVKAGGRIDIQSEAGSAPGTYRLKLSIKDVKPEDGGNYKVNAKNDAGEANANINLSLEGKVAKIVNEPPSIKRENDGRTLAMEFRLESPEKPEIQWMYKGKPIKPGGRFFVDLARDGDYWVPVLEIDGVKPEDAGEYKCMVKTSGGEVPKVINVTSDMCKPVEEKPEEKKPEEKKKKKKPEEKKPEEKPEEKKKPKKKKVPTATLR